MPEQDAANLANYTHQCEYLDRVDCDLTKPGGR